jgi:hypothetical protein
VALVLPATGLVSGAVWRSVPSLLGAIAALVIGGVCVGLLARLVSGEPESEESAAARPD